jgi:hypothetical protein
MDPKSTGIDCQILRVVTDGFTSEVGFKTTTILPLNFLIFFKNHL